MNAIKEYLQALDALPWRRSQDGEWTMITTENWKAWNYGAVEKLRVAEYRLLLTIIGFGVLAFLVGFGVCWIIFAH